MNTDTNLQSINEISIQHTEDEDSASTFRNRVQYVQSNQSGYSVSILRDSSSINTYQGLHAPLLSNPLSSHDDGMIAGSKKSKNMNWRKRLFGFFRLKKEEEKFDIRNNNHFFNQIVQDLSVGLIGPEPKGNHHLQKQQQNQQKQKLDHQQQPQETSGLTRKSVTSNDSHNTKDKPPLNIYAILYSLSQWIPVFECESLGVMTWEFLVCVYLCMYFFIIPMNICFDGVIDGLKILQLSEIVLLALLALAMVQALNTNIYMRGELIGERSVIFSKRFRSGQIFIDGLCITLVSLNISYPKSDLIPYFLIAFYLKIISLRKFNKKILKIIQLMRRIKATYLLLRLTLGIMFLCHVAACLYLTIGKYQTSKGEVSWMKRGDFNITDSTFAVQFEWAFYWAVTTILTVGYGDITPQAPNEVFITIVCMLVSCIIFAYCINSIWEILQELNSKEAKYLEIMNAINRYMRDKKVNSSLQRRIGAYIEYQYKKQRSRDESLEQGIIMKLAPNLREELIYEAHVSLFDSIPWMKYFSAEFIKSLAFFIEEYNYSEKEIIYQMGIDEEDETNSQGLYFLKEGKAECYIPYSEGIQQDIVFEHRNLRDNGYGKDPPKNSQREKFPNSQHLKKDIFLRDLLKQQYFGETSIFSSSNAIDFSVKSVEFTTIYKISKKKFLETIRKFPDDYEIYCEIKEKLENKADISENFSSLNPICENCAKKKDSIQFNHSISECPLIMPYYSLKSDNNRYIVACKEQQHRGNFKRETQKKRWRNKVNYLASCARQAYQNFGERVSIDADSLMSLSQLSILSQGGITERGDEEEEKDNENSRILNLNNSDFGDLKMPSQQSFSSRSMLSLRSQGEFDQDNGDDIGDQEIEGQEGQENEQKKQVNKLLEKENTDTEEVKEDHVSNEQLGQILEGYDNSSISPLNDKNEELSKESNIFTAVEPSLQSSNKDSENKDQYNPDNQMNLKKITPKSNGYLQNKALLKKGKVSDYVFSSEINQISTNQGTGTFATSNSKNIQSLNYFNNPLNTVSMGSQKQPNKHSKTLMGTSKFHKQQSYPKQQTAALSPTSGQQPLNNNNVIHPNSSHSTPLSLPLTGNILHKNITESLHEIKNLIREEVGKFRILFDRFNKNSVIQGYTDANQETLLQAVNPQGEQDGLLPQQYLFPFEKNFTKQAIYVNATQEAKAVKGDQINSIILDIDKMFRFKKYRKDYNYDAVLKRERARQKRMFIAAQIQNQSQQNQQHQIHQGIVNRTRSQRRQSNYHQGQLRVPQVTYDALLRQYLRERARSEYRQSVNSSQ